jgi:hypothetical protein
LSDLTALTLALRDFWLLHNRFPGALGIRPAAAPAA